MDDPLGQTSEKGYLGIFTLKMGRLSVFKGGKVMGPKNKKKQD